MFSLLIQLYVQYLCNICPVYTHILDGKPVHSPMIHHQCPASRTIYVPCNISLRLAVVVPDHLSPHSHPMPPPIKVSDEAKEVYMKCIKAQGVLAATVKKVDLGKLLLNYKKQGLISGMT